jgi:hypothetical protein
MGIRGRPRKRLVGMKSVSGIVIRAGLKFENWIKNGGRALVISRSLNSPFPSKLSLFVLAWNKDLPSGSTRAARITKLPPLSTRRATCGEKESSQLAVMKNPHNTGVQPNDIVIFAGHLGMWKVVAPVNGSKADIRRNEGFDTRIVTARLERLTFMRRPGSPEYSY